MSMIVPASCIPVQHITTITDYQKNFPLNAIPSKKYYQYCNVVDYYLKFDEHFVNDFKIVGYKKGKRYEVSDYQINSSYIYVNAIDYDFFFIESSFVTDLIVYVDPQYHSDICLAHVICTYQRIDQVNLKINELEDILSDKYHLIIIDNNSEISSICSPYITVIHSQNYGGSGGFCRGMIESTHHPYSHILLNDDDAFADKETIFRLIAFLSCLSPDHDNYLLGGLVTDSSNINKIYDAGGCYQGFITLQKNGSSINNVDDYCSIVDNYPVDYIAWTFCCFPSKIINDVGFPLPLFIYCDDVEYGLRISDEMIVIPHLLIQHPFKSTTPLYYYYFYRNSFICLSSSDLNYKPFINQIFKQILIEISAYRYSFASEMISGLNDYLRGPEYVFSLCKSGPRQKIVIDYKNADELVKTMNIVDSVPKKSFLIRLFSINGLLFKPLGDLDYCGPVFDSSLFYRAGKILFRIDNTKGFITHRNVKKTIVLCFKVLLLRIRMFFTLKQTIRKFKKTIPYYSSLLFWSKIFN